MVEETMPITGGCLCGAVRYEANELPSKGVVCHCHVCQRTTGSAFEASSRTGTTSILQPQF